MIWRPWRWCWRWVWYPGGREPDWGGYIVDYDQLDTSRYEGSLPRGWVVWLWRRWKRLPE